MSPLRVNMPKRHRDSSPTQSHKPRPLSIVPIFLTLAPELIQHIGEELGSSKKVLRLVCRHLNRAIESQVLSHISINFDTETAGSCPDQLEMLALAKDSAIPYYARSITLKSLSLPCAFTDIVPRIQPPNRDNMIWPRDILSPKPEVFENSLKKFHEFLGPAISKLTNIQTATWIVHQQPSECVLNTVMEHLTVLPSLSNFHLTFSCNFAQFDLTRFAHLQQINIDGTNSTGFNDQTAKSLSKTIAASPKLTHLQLDSGLLSIDPYLPSIKDLFFALPSDQTSRLTHLNLGGFRTQVSNEALRHLHCLRSLALSNILTEGTTTSYSPYIPTFLGTTSPTTTSTLYGSDESELTNETSAAEPKEKTEDPQETGVDISLWNHLRQSEIHLESLTIDFMDDDVLDYLQSYSGLKRLALKRVATLNPGTVVNRFFNQVLPKHQNTIESLIMMPLYEGKWCHDTAYDSVLQQCLRLRELGWAVNAYQMPASYNALDVMLDTAALIPSLTHLQIFAANDPGYAFAPYGTPGALYLQKVSKLICEGIETFPATPDFAKLKWITGPGKCYVLQRSKEDDSFQYDPVEGEVAVGV